MSKTDSVVAIILGAGLSTRMGSAKLMLPWKNTTILGNIVSTLTLSEIQEVVVVIHPDHDQLKEHIKILSDDYPVRFTMNKSFRPEDMLTSIQYGLKAINYLNTAALIVLGDQPQIEENTIRQIIRSHKQMKSSIIIPSFSMRRGHPWIIPHQLISKFMKLKYPLTARDFLEHHKNEIKYVIMDNDSILKDVDTPEDYQAFKPGI